MSENSDPLNPCGSSCGSCPNFLGNKEPRCPGCASNKGRPWWGECRIYACSASHGVDHCGACGEFPCDNFVSHFDPGNPEGQRNAVVRAGLLAYRAKHGDEKTLALLSKIEKPPRQKVP